MKDNFITEANAFVLLPNSKKFKHGLNSRKWFCEKYFYLLYFDDFWCKKVLDDYQKAIMKDDSYQITNEEIEKLSEVPAELDARMKEFSLTDNPFKFDKNSAVVFSDGTLMGLWFNQHKKLILMLDKRYLNIINFEYEDYLKKSNVSALSEDDFFKKLKLFVKIDEINKFNQNFGIKFYDGTLVSSWFLDNFERISNGSCPDSKMAIRQYNYYLTSILNPVTFLQKANYFYVCHDLEKFNGKTKLSFPDGTSFSTWFFKYKKRIFLSDELVCKSIKTQYESYKKHKNNDLKTEFINNQNQDKFNKKSHVLFSDNTLMANWFYDNFESIFISNSSCDEKIKRQYNDFLKNNNFVFPRLFSDKIDEFLSLPINKFSILENVLFADGSYAFSWFEKYKKIIISNDDYRCLMILEEYKEYLGLNLFNKEKRKVYKKEAKR